jgi:hypothetical protein
MYESPRVRCWFVCCVAIAVMHSANVSHAEQFAFSIANGEILVEVDDPDVSVSLEDDELKISGIAGREIRLKTGNHLFQRAGIDDAGGHEVLSIAGDDGGIAVRVIAKAAFNPLDEVLEADRFRDVLLERSGEQANKLVGLRSALDDRVWREVTRRYTTTESAKLLIAFFRGDGTIADFSGTEDEAKQLKDGLAELRQGRQKQFALVSEIALLDEQRAASPLVGTWEITGIRGAGGMAADALELYEPDPVQRKFVATNDSAVLLTGAGTWLFDATYPDDEGGTVDLSVVVRGNTVYRGRFDVDNDTATLRLNPMNEPRPESAEGDPRDGGFVLELKRVKSG